MNHTNHIHTRRKTPPKKNSTKYQKNTYNNKTNNNNKTETRSADPNVYDNPTNEAF